jgi:RNA polymerase sigma-70 factor (ECF subfamily)
MQRSRDTRQETTSHLSTATAERVLLASCKAGDHAAFMELIQRGSGMARRAIRSIACNPADVEDVMQDTVIAAFKGLRSFDERSKFSTWLTRIAINNALMLLRRRKTRGEISYDADIVETHSEIPNLVDKAIGPEQFLIREQSIKVVRKAVRALPRTLREYVELHCLQELRPREVASSLGISLAAGKDRLFHARRRLGRSLASLRSQPDFRNDR